MSGHADTIRRYLVAQFSSKQESDEAWAALDALVAANQQLRDALEQASVRLGELTQPPWNELTPLVAEVRDDIRAALAATPSEDTE